MIPKKRRTCACGSSSGVYLADGLHAEFSGDWAVPLGLDNNTLKWGAANYADFAMSSRIDAWIIPVSSDRIKKVKECSKRKKR
jgi:hypothetical protein